MTDSPLQISDHDAKVVENLIDDISEKFHVEYDDYKHIHVSHGIVALVKMGAPLDRIERYVEDYIKLTALHEVYEPDVVITDDNWQDNFGTDGLERYPALLKYFKNLISQNGWQKVLKETGPILLRGMVGGLFHGVIQTGMGIEGVKRPNQTMIAEGLAWTANSYLGISSSKGDVVRIPSDPETERSELDPLSYILETVARAIKTNAFEETHTLGKQPFYSDQHFHPVLRQIRLMSEDINPNLDFHKIFNHSAISLRGNIDDLIGAVTVTIATVYLSTKPEFYCLHAVTGWWALRFWLPHLSEDDQREAIAHFIRAVLAVYIERGLPGVDRLPSLIAVLQAPESGEHELFETHDAPPKSHDWNAVLEKALKFTDTHESKAIHALYEDWKKYGFRKVFYDSANQHLTESIYYNVNKERRPSRM